MPGEELKLNKTSKPMNEKPVSRRQEKERGSQVLKVQRMNQKREAMNESLPSQRIRMFPPGCTVYITL